LTEAEWARLVERAKANVDVLEDGAYVRAEAAEGGVELQFFASSLNKPTGWRYGFTESVNGSKRLAAYVGRAWHHTDTGFVEFEVRVLAAAQSLVADYEGGAGDFDDATFELEVERAMHGTPADREWLMREFARLTKVSGQ
jgi:hypothetical protein